MSELLVLCGGWCLQSHHRFCSSARYLLREWICATRAIRKASSFEVVPSPTKPPGRIAFVCTACDACQSWGFQVPSFDKQRKFSGNQRMDYQAPFGDVAVHPAFSCQLEGENASILVTQCGHCPMSRVGYSGSLLNRSPHSTTQYKNSKLSEIKL